MTVCSELCLPKLAPCELIKIHQWENNQQLVIPFIGVFHPTITTFHSEKIDQKSGRVDSCPIANVFGHRGKNVCIFYRN